MLFAHQTTLSLLSLPKGADISYLLITPYFPLAPFCSLLATHHACISLRHGGTSECMYTIQHLQSSVSVSSPFSECPSYFSVLSKSLPIPWGGNLSCDHPSRRDLRSVTPWARQGRDEVGSSRSTFFRPLSRFLPPGQSTCPLPHSRHLGTPPVAAASKSSNPQAC